jgi:hypothetical protein
MWSSAQWKVAAGDHVAYSIEGAIGIKHVGFFGSHLIGDRKLGTPTVSPPWCRRSWARQRSGMRSTWRAPLGAVVLRPRVVPANSKGRATERRAGCIAGKRHHEERGLQEHARHPRQCVTERRSSQRASSQESALGVLRSATPGSAVRKRRLGAITRRGSSDHAGPG